jgi:hypothetical protein
VEVSFSRHKRHSARPRHADITRFDYTGHGLSSGTFAGTHLGDWFRDALLAVDSLTDEAAPLVVVGAHHGGCGPCRKGARRRQQRPPLPLTCASRLSPLLTVVCFLPR